MDIYCPKCAEPTDNDTLHDAVEDGTYSNYREAAAAFRSEGCSAIGYSCNPDTTDSFRAMVADAMGDVLGDDMDGISSMMEDFEYFGMLD